jgi:hypothetical protein
MRMGIKNIYIHVGLGRTATTWLQELIFSHNININYLGKTLDNYPKWLIELHYFDNYFFQKNLKRIKKEIKSLFKANKINLLSSEAFTRVGGETHNQAERIRETFGNVRIILILRNPIDIIMSFYKFNVGDGKFLLNLEECFDWSLTPFVLYKRKPIYLPDYFYNNTIDIYHTLFGADNTCILKYEDMVGKTDYFFNQLGSFMNVDFDMKIINEKKTINVNASPDKSQIVSTQARNFLNYLEKYFPSVAAKVDMEDIAKDIITEIMPEDLNNRLEDYFKNKCYDYF